MRYKRHWFEVHQWRRGCRQLGRINIELRTKQRGSNEVSAAGRIKLLVAPAEVTVDIGSFSREAKKDIRKGTRDIWLMAFRALFEVSLYSCSRLVKNGTGA